jgi:hypothetical protein
MKIKYKSRVVSKEQKQTKPIPFETKLSEKLDIYTQDKIKRTLNFDRLELENILDKCLNFQKEISKNEKYYDDMEFEREELRKDNDIRTNNYRKYLLLKKFKNQKKGKTESFEYFFRDLLAEYKARGYNINELIEKKNIFEQCCLLFKKRHQYNNYFRPLDKNLLINNPDQIYMEKLELMAAIGLSEAERQELIKREDLLLKYAKQTTKRAYARRIMFFKDETERLKREFDILKEDVVKAREAIRSDEVSKRYKRFIKGNTHDEVTKKTKKPVNLLNKLLLNGKDELKGAMLISTAKRQSISSSRDGSTISKSNEGGGHYVRTEETRRTITPMANNNSIRNIRAVKQSYFGTVIHTPSSPVNIKRRFTQDAGSQNMTLFAKKSESNIKVNESNSIVTTLDNNESALLITEKPQRVIRTQQANHRRRQEILEEMSLDLSRDRSIKDFKRRMREYNEDFNVMDSKTLESRINQSYHPIDIVRNVQDASKRAGEMDIPDLFKGEVDLSGDLENNINKLVKLDKQMKGLSKEVIGKINFL